MTDEPKPGDPCPKCERGFVGPDGSCSSCDWYYHICDYCTHFTEKAERFCIAGLECPEFPDWEEIHIRG